MFVHCLASLRRVDVGRNVCGRRNLHISSATKRRRTKSLATNIQTIPRNMPTNFEPKRLKPKFDIVKNTKIECIN